MPSFVLKDAKYVLLTYPQVPETEADAFPDLLTSVLSSGPILAEFTAARELHADGGIHFHAFVDFGRKFSTRNVRLFDVGGRHPNIERVGRTPRRVYDYVIKDGDVVAGSCEAPDASGDSQQGESQADWSGIVLAETRDEFFEAVERYYPRALVLSFISIARYADWRYKLVPEPYQHPEHWTFNLDRYPVLLDWIDESLRGGAERSVLPALHGRRLRGTGPPRP